MNPEYYNKAHERTINNSDLLEQTNKRTEYIASFLKPKHKNIPFNVLDIGCGLGTLSNYLGEDNDYVGIDYSKTALSYAMENFPKDYFSTYILADFRNFINYYIKPEVFDFVVMSEIIEHLEQERVDIQLASIAKKCSQKMVITVPVDMPNEPSHIKPTWTQKDIEDITKFCGKIIDLHKFGVIDGKETWWLCVIERN